MWAGFAEHAQLLLPMIEPIQNTGIVVGEPMHGAGRALVERLLVVSAQEVAGDKHPWSHRRRRVLARFSSPAGS